MSKPRIRHIISIILAVCSAVASFAGPSELGPTGAELQDSATTAASASAAVAARVAALQHLTKSAVAADQLSGYVGLCQIARDTPEKADAQEAVTALVRIFDDPPWADHGYPYMSAVSADRFPDEAKQYLRAQLRLRDKRDRGYRAVVLVVGIANMKDEIPFLKTFGTDFPLDRDGHLYYGSVEWAAVCARARMGDDDATSLCVALVREQPDKDCVATTLLSSLAYIRHPEAVALISEYLFSDSFTQQKGRDVLPYDYAKLAIRALRGTIEGFPAITASRDRAEEIKISREWMSKQESFEFIK